MVVDLWFSKVSAFQLAHWLELETEPFKPYAKKKTQQEGITVRYIKERKKKTQQEGTINPVHHENTPSSDTWRIILSATIKRCRIVGGNPDGSNVVWHLTLPRHLTRRPVFAYQATTWPIRFSSLTATPNGPYRNLQDPTPRKGTVHSVRAFSRNRVQAARPGQRTLLTTPNNNVYIFFYDHKAK